MGQSLTFGRDPVKRVRVIIPVATSLWDESVSAQMARFKDPDTVIEVVHLPMGPEALEDFYDEAYAVRETLEEVVRAQKEDADGVIIYCYGDPALRAAKTAVSIPVVGLAEASSHLASLLGPRFGIVSVGPPHGALADMDNLRVYELAHKCVGSETIGVPVLELPGGNELERVVQVGRSLIEKGASVLVLGCGGLLDVAEAASAELGVPVIMPAAAALKLCEAMIVIGLSHSKMAFGTPGNKERR
jgi:allantoin racemase